MASCRYAGLLFLLISAGVAAHDDEPAVVDSLLVDTAEVVAAGEVRPVDGITSSGQPGEPALKVFADSGYSAVIDLRGPSESRGLDEAAVVEGLGMSYVPFPISGADAINFDNAAKLKTLIELQDGPVLVHCGSGNRVGALLALAEALDGADAEQAIAAGKAGGLTRLEPVVRERLAERESSD